MTASWHDVLVIGGGSGGYLAAIRAARDDGRLYRGTGPARRPLPQRRLYFVQSVAQFDGRVPRGLAGEARDTISVTCIDVRSAG